MINIPNNRANTSRRKPATKYSNQEMKNSRKQRTVNPKSQGVMDSANTETRTEQITTGRSRRSCMENSLKDFIGDDVTLEGILTKRKKTETLRTFEADIKWASNKTASTDETDVNEKADDPMIDAGELKDDEGVSKTIKSENCCIYAEEQILISSDTDGDMDYDTDGGDPDWDIGHASPESNMEDDFIVPDSGGENSDTSETWSELTNLQVKLAKEDEVLSTTKIDKKIYEKIKDINVPEIFFRKIVKNETFNNKKKKTDRTQNSRHSCKFCGKCLSHIQDHLRRRHSDREEVKAIEKCKDLQTREKLKDQLRYMGDHLHNKEVVQKKAGELILYRRPDQEFDHTQFGPCPECKVWMLKNSLVKHTKTCNGGTKITNEKKRCLITMSDVTKEVALQPTGENQMLVNEVFTIMTMDEIGLVAKEDELIRKLGDHWLKSCIDDRKKRSYWASQHMTLMAKLLISVRDMENNFGLTMWDILRPSFFNSLVKAALNVSLPDIDDIEELKSPTNVIKLNHDLIRMGGFKASKSCEMYDKTGESEWKKSRKAADELLVEINRWWKVKCTKLARKVLLERKPQKKEQLPKPEDIKKLGEFLISELKTVNLGKEDVTYATYRYYVELVQARLLTYNKRRTGEVEDISVKNYMHKLDVSDIDEGLMGDVTETERYLLNTHDLIQTRGKRGGIVPVLIPQECKPVLDFLVDAGVRQKLEIKSSYVFASKSSEYPVRAYNSLKKVCDVVGLDRPQDITSTNMRKYMATLAQVMNLTDNEMQQMCRHLGHTTRVHLTHYRAMSPYIERVTLGKILLMQDLNIQTKFQMKPLSEIDFSDIINEETTKKNATMANADSTSTENNTFEFEEIDINDPEPKNRSKTSKGRVYGKRQRWSAKEINELNHYFSKQLREKVAPRRADCIKAKHASFKNNGEIHQRPWHLIVKKVSNLNHKKK